jgi:hypothetical protein
VSVPEVLPDERNKQSGHASRRERRKREQNIQDAREFIRKDCGSKVVGIHESATYFADSLITASKAQRQATQAAVHLLKLRHLERKGLITETMKCSLEFRITSRD